MSRILTFFLILLAATAARAEIRTETIDYQVGEARMTGYLAYDEAVSGPRPGILVVHEWWGHTDYVRRRAEMLARLGYTAFALDMYGDGKVADHPETATGFMKEVLGNLPEAQRRFEAARIILAQHSSVDPERIAAIGYCFGGGVVLHMARAGADLDAVVSFHGSLATEQPAQPGDVEAQVLVFTGADDVMVPPEQVQAFEREMTAANAQYELISYSNVKHSFTNPAADGFAKRFGMPLEYNAQADAASWQRMQSFLQQVFFSN